MFRQNVLGAERRLAYPRTIVVASISEDVEELVGRLTPDSRFCGALSAQAALSTSTTPGRIRSIWAQRGDSGEAER